MQHSNHKHLHRQNYPRSRLKDGSTCARQLYHSPPLRESCKIALFITAPMQNIEKVPKKLNKKLLVTRRLLIVKFNLISLDETFKIEEKNDPI